MVQLDGGRFATSDLNDLYRRVINRNNRLKRLLDLGAPEIIVNNEKRMLQEAVDSLFDNGRRGRPVTGPGNRPLKSLSDMLKGKQGRFRQNLLGKRVDYSGRSVIVSGPQLKLHQCGLPKQMALELFKPFVMKRLVDLSHSQNIKSAKRMVERATSGLSRYAVVWDVLEEVITEHPVLLNRAPTLHRLGIQAFEPQLIEGKAIQIHPLVCSAFNADFDGDQMAVHLPLSAEAQAEARILMLSTNNILKPSDGRPVTMPTLDMIIGLFFLTTDREGEPGEGRAFSSAAEAIMALDRGDISLQSKVKIRFTDIVPPLELELGADWEEGQSITLDTTLGRALFNDTLPADYPFVNYEVGKKAMGAIINDLAERYTKVEVAASLDALKDTGFHWATRSGVTVSIDDVTTPEKKGEILAEYEGQAVKVQKQFERGLVTDEERRQELVEIWTQASNDVAKEMEKSFDRKNPIFMMVDSGASGNMMQIRQVAAMRGLVANPRGDIIPRPIKANFREGLSVLEYFISTHGARKGLADTALRTADSGYLTRRLVDVSQDVIIREDDCGTERGMDKRIGVRGEDGSVRKDDNVETSAYARTTAVDISHPETGEVLAAAGDDLGDVKIGELVAAGIEIVRVRSVLTCEAKTGTCAKCYGRSLATGKMVDIGEAVGIIAAQSIGEPGTQLTMRTFHTGGVASADDITQGLPRCPGDLRGAHPQGAFADLRGRRPDRDRGDRQDPQGPGHPRRRLRRARVPRLEALPPAGRRRRPHRGRRHADRRDARAPRGPAHPRRPQGPGAPGRRGPGGLPQPGRVDPRQAHRDHRAADAAPGHGDRVGATPTCCRPTWSTACVRGGEPSRGLRGRQAGLGSSGADGHHEGLAGHRVVALGRLLPGDDPGAHRRGDPRPLRQPAWPEGERDHRQADPGRHRPGALPQHPGGADRGGARRGVRRHRLRLLRLRVRGRRPRAGRRSRRLRLSAPTRTERRSGLMRAGARSSKARPALAQRGRALVVSRASRRKSSENSPSRRKEATKSRRVGAKRQRELAESACDNSAKAALGACRVPMYG